MKREWSRSELEDYKTVAWLKRMNAKGNDIYIRPANKHGLVLVDQITVKALKTMQEKDFIPAVALQTSPGVYQVWVKFSDQPLAEDVRIMATRLLTSEFGGRSTSNNYGRLAGFTNQQPECARNGLQPYVLVQSCSGVTAGAAQTMLGAISTVIELESVAAERELRLQALMTSSDRNHALSYDPIREYQQQAKKLLVKYEGAFDFVLMDRSIAEAMAKSGRFSQQDIERGISECSPNVVSRKDSGMSNYARGISCAAHLKNKNEKEIGKEIGKGGLEHGF
jgi:hypothetical protein